MLLSKQTNCLAQDECGIPAEQLKENTKHHAARQVVDVADFWVKYPIALGGK